MGEGVGVCVRGRTFKKVNPILFTLFQHKATFSSHGSRMQILIIVLFVSSHQSWSVIHSLWHRLLAFRLEQRSLCPSLSLRRIREDVLPHRWTYGENTWYKSSPAWILYFFSSTYYHMDSLHAQIEVLLFDDPDVEATTPGLVLDTDFLIWGIRYGSLASSWTSIRSSLRYARQRRINACNKIKEKVIYVYSKSTCNSLYTSTWLI